MTAFILKILLRLKLLNGSVLFISSRVAKDLAAKTPELTLCVLCLNLNDLEALETCLSRFDC